MIYSSTFYASSAVALFALITTNHTHTCKQATTHSHTRAHTHAVPVDISQLHILCEQCCSPLCFDFNDTHTRKQATTHSHTCTHTHLFASTSMIHTRQPQHTATHVHKHAHTLTPLCFNFNDTHMPATHTHTSLCFNFNDTYMLATAHSHICTNTHTHISSCWSARSVVCASYTVIHLLQPYTHQEQISHTHTHTRTHTCATIHTSATNQTHIHAHTDTHPHARTLTHTHVPPVAGVCGPQSVRAVLLFIYCNHTHICNKSDTHANRHTPARTLTHTRTSSSRGVWSAVCASGTATPARVGGAEGKAAALAGKGGRALRGLGNDVCE